MNWSGAGPRNPDYVNILQIKIKSFYAFKALVASNEFIFEQIQSNEPNTIEPTSKLNPSKNPEISSISPISPVLPISKTENEISHDTQTTKNDLRSKEMLNR